MEITETNYKGNPCVSFSKGKDDKYPKLVGFKKAMLVIENLEEVKAIVRKEVEANLFG